MKKNKMRSSTVCLLMLIASAYAQEDHGNIEGRVTGPFDGIVSDVPVRALHIESGESWRTRSDSNGLFAFDALPVGEIRIQVRTLCCEYLPYQSEPIQLRAGSGTVFDIQLSQGFQLNTIGDDIGIATAQILENQDIPDAPLPRKEDGTPDMTGMWMFGADPFPPPPKLTSWAAELVAKRTANHFVESPRIHCLPTALPIASHTPPIFGKFVHTPDLIVILFEGILGYRQIFMDGRDHPEDPNPSWLGHSIGWWEGDVLVVDTVGFNDRGWTGLTHPRSEQFHVTERYRRTTYGDMELEFTIEDPEVYEEPWVRQMPIYLAPNEELLEFVCENEKWVNPVSN